MPKRFTDTEKWRKGFIRSLQAPYKLLWFYICDECDHAGIWHVELDVAGLRIGKGVNIDNPLDAFGDHIVPFDNGEKWFIPDFIDFQYGELNPANRVHQSVIARLNKYGLNKPKTSPLQGAKDKEKAKDKDKDKYKEKAKELCSTFLLEIQRECPNTTAKISETWISDMEKLLRIDGRSFGQVEKVILWATHDHFWSANILSPAKLRKQFEQLDRKMNSNHPTIPMEKLTAAEQLQRRNDEALRRAMEE